MKTPRINRHSIASKQKQQGVVLFISLVFLLVMTFMGLYVMRSSIQQLQMADNAGSKIIAFERAEAARAYAEGLINAKADLMSTGADFNCNTNGYFARSALAIVGCSVLNADALAWDNDDSFAVPDSEGQRYAIEYQGIDEVLEPNAGVEVGVGVGSGVSDTIDVYVFKIIVRGGESAGGLSILQTIFVARKSS
jgi:Tfp pilus assembly protein PilX